MTSCLQQFQQYILQGREAAVQNARKRSPNSRGRLSLNLLTDPQRSTEIRGGGKTIPRKKIDKEFFPLEKEKENGRALGWFGFHAPYFYVSWMCGSGEWGFTGATLSGIKSDQAWSIPNPRIMVPRNPVPIKNTPLVFRV